MERGRAQPRNDDRPRQGREGEYGNADGSPDVGLNYYQGGGAALALLPIVLEGEHPGNEILAPLSVVILGGLLTSTFLNLILVPAGYAAIHRVHEPSSSGPQPIAAGGSAS